MSQETFWPLIHALARQGIYLVDTQSDANINHSMIASTNPFKEVSYHHSCSSYVFNGKWTDMNG